MADADYDGLVLAAEPDGLKSKADKLTEHAKNIAGHLEDINKMLGSLELGWAGQSSQEAQEVTSEWTRVLGELFGTDDEPEKGVLNALAVSVHNTAANFAQAEQHIKEVFQKFHDDLNKDKANAMAAARAAAGSSDPQATYDRIIDELNGPPQAPQDHQDPTETAIFTDYPDA